jgi:PEGA domain
VKRARYEALSTFALVSACATSGGGASGHVNVRSSLGDGTLYIDARPSSSGTAWSVDVGAGTHVLELRRGASVVAVEHVTVMPGHEVEVVLQHGLSASDAAVGSRLVVMSPNAGAMVYVDGIRAGLVTQTLDVVPGPHDIEVVLTGMQPYREAVLVSAGTQVELEVRLEEAP